MYKAILFDLDGTLTDSGEGITKSVQYATEDMPCGLRPSAPPCDGRGQTDGRPAGAPASEPALKSPAEKEKARPQRLRSCRYPPRPKRLAPIPDPYAAPRNIFRSGIYCTVNQN